MMDWMVSRLWRPRLVPRRILVALVQTGVLGRLCPKAIAFDRAWRGGSCRPSRRLGGMTFTSWQFGIFVGIVFGAYYLPPLRTLKIQLLVIASLFFYGYGQPELLPLLAVAVFGTYLFLSLALRNRPV
jgi:hypothetical protein